MSSIINGSTVAIRRLSKEDVDAVLAIDSAAVGHSRRQYFERRLAAALREPALHVQYASRDSDGLNGFVLARRLDGEFGRREPSLRLEAIGVAERARGRGVGHALVAALTEYARTNSITELRTTARWNQHEMLAFIDGEGFVLGGAQVVESMVHTGPLGGSERARLSAPERPESGSETDYSHPAANDFEALARDRCDVRSLTAADADDIIRIDRRLMGQDREGYVRRQIDEALFDSAIRVSLTARRDGNVAGFVMAKVDFGDFGRTEPVAVIDTIGVDPGYAHLGVGHALLSQLFVNLSALRVERVESVVAREDFELLGFLYSTGFDPSQRLAFVKRFA